MTEYTFHSEITTSVAASQADQADRFLAYDTSTGRTSWYGGAALQALVLGTTSAQLMGFYGATSVTQPTSSNEAAVASTAASSTTPFGFTTSTQANAIVTLVNQLRADLVTLGLIKGS